MKASFDLEVVHELCVLVFVVNVLNHVLTLVQIGVVRIIRKFEMSFDVDILPWQRKYQKLKYVQKGNEYLHTSTCIKTENKILLTNPLSVIL